MQQDFETAREISEYLLEQTGGALMSGDFTAFQHFFSLPQEIQTFDGAQKVETPQELKMIFDAVRTHFARSNVTVMVRHCVEAAFKDRDTVEATHETRLLNGSVIAQSPYAVFSVLKRTETGWRIAHSAYAIADQPDHNKALLGHAPQKATSA